MFKEQQRAQFLSHFLKFRYEAIKEVVAKMMECIVVLNRYLTTGAKKDEAQEITDKIDECFVAINDAKIWLTDDVAKAILEYTTLFRRLELHIRKTIGKKLAIPDQKDLEKLLEIDSIFEKLRKEAGIELFKKYEKSIN